MVCLMLPVSWDRQQQQQQGLSCAGAYCARLSVHGTLRLTYVSPTDISAAAGTCCHIDPYSITN
jgi:hypothetical protein